MEVINLPARVLLPHRVPMLLVDHAIEGDDHSIWASATVSNDCIFVNNGSLPAWCLLEYMAQTMALWVCWQAKKKNLAPPVGFLLGTRHLALHENGVPVGTELRFLSQRLYVSDEGLAQFDCQTYLNGRLIASARINAYQPPSTNDTTMETSL